jgi:hypothetical protein
VAARLLLASLVLSLLGCATKVVLRDPEVYKNELAFFEMALQQDTALLKAHLADGSCSCDESGAWNNEVCETSALNILVIDQRLRWHLDMMLYNGRLLETRPPIEPEVPEPSSLCPAK